MALQKDSAIIEIYATDDNGYFIRGTMWNQTPPPVPHRDLDNTTPIPTVRTDRTADDRAELVSLITGFLNNVFDQP